MGLWSVLWGALWGRQYYGVRYGVVGLWGVLWGALWGYGVRYGAGTIMGCPQELVVAVSVEGAALQHRPEPPEQRWYRQVGGGAFGVPPLWGPLYGVPLFGVPSLGSPLCTLMVKDSRIARHTCATRV